MKRKLTLFFFILFLLIPFGHGLAEERNIYVGDLIELKVITHAFSEEEMRERFSEFEIVALESKTDGYLLTLRTFETGEKTVQLGDKEIVIHVNPLWIHTIEPMSSREAPMSGTPGFHRNGESLPGFPLSSFWLRGEFFWERLFKKGSLPASLHCKNLCRQLTVFHLKIKMLSYNSLFA